MDPFNGDTPNLINNKTLKDIEIDLNIPFEEKSNNMINGIGSFYTNYIESNMFPLIVISLLALYLTIKYVIKRDREENNSLSTYTDAPIIRIKKKPTTKKKGIILKKKPKVNKQLTKPGNTIPDDSNISDMISDDYLLTDETDQNTIVNDNNNEDRLLATLGLQNVMPDSEYIDESITQLPMSGMLNNNMGNNEPVYDVNKATSLVFGN
jgi:hypothetical protein